MSKLEIIDRTLLHNAAEAAAASPRRRKNYNFHANDGDACHRLLNAVEPDSYIPPHCHLDPSKDETMVVLRGTIGVVLFGAAGEVLRTVVLQAGGETLGINIPHGQIHALLALEPGSIFFEAKAGPFVPVSAQERAFWAPAEGTPEAEIYLKQLKEMFATT